MEILNKITVLFRLDIFMEATTMKREQSDICAHCLQYRLPKNINEQDEQTAIVVTGEAKD